ncbi:MAG: transposase [Armatimonadetes bacterium]|nr:transposase [Armatimonadota bacterium]MDE2207157.1 transposase [Armatimonadota bacterium]
MERAAARFASASEPVWHSRGYLPHFEAGEVAQHIVFRLADSLPRRIVAAMAARLADLPASQIELERRKRTERVLDSGYGACWLRQPEVAQIVEGALLYFDGDRYRLHAWTVMPNHVHVLVTPLGANTLSGIVHAWKSYTANKANRIVGACGQFWQSEYYDRAIRDDTHFTAAVFYIAANPVKAALCADPIDWPFGSARLNGA